MLQQLIFSTRLAWRPPSKVVFINISSIFSASPSRTNLAGMQSTLALLCLRASSASSSPQQMAARMPWCLFAVMATPFALPHKCGNVTKILRSELLLGG
jgi:hypothetical protein